MSLTVMEVGSLERQTRTIVNYIHQSLAELLVQIAEEQGRALLEGRRELEDIDPDDLGGTPW